MTAPVAVHPMSVRVEHGQILVSDAVEGDLDAVAAKALGTRQRRTP